MTIDSLYMPTVLGKTNINRAGKKRPESLSESLSQKLFLSETTSGAVVTVGVGAGQNCAGTNAVTLSGDGVPSGSFTIADLTGAGITLAALTDGQSTTPIYSCEVN